MYRLLTHRDHAKTHPIKKLLSAADTPRKAEPKSQQDSPKPSQKSGEPFQERKGPPDFISPIGPSC